MPTSLTPDPELSPQPLFAWPTPPYAAYARRGEQKQAMDVEVEGLNGKRMLARMTFFVPESQTVYVQVPPSRTALSLRFDQFRCLRLLETLIPDDQAFSSTPEINLRPRQPYQLTLQDGHELSGETVGVTETRYGCFLFPPVNERGEVQTLFVPAAQIRQTRIGQPIGLCLVDQDVVSREAVDHAAEVQDAMRSQRLGEILLSMQVVTPDALLQALERQSQMPMMRIGEALIGLNLISASQLDEALERQRSDRSVPLGTVLIRMGLVSEGDLQGALARKMGYPLVDVLHFPVEPEALKAVPPAMALRLQVLPLLHREGRLVMAMNDPTRRATQEELEFITQNKVAPVLADTKSLEDAIRSAYDRAGLLIDPGSGPIPYDGDDQDTEALLEDLEREGEVQDADDDRVIDTSDNSLVKLINNMIMEAHAQRVSDIHIETYPGREKIKIRFRVDGQLRPYVELPHTYRSALIARLKIMCDLDISERRRPQDGKISFGKFVQGQRIELRVVTIPTSNGLEDIVMRMLSAAKPIPLERLDLHPRSVRELKAAMERPYGLVLCVGPTGSGKTTTLHSALAHINVPERKIWTAEDPVEITQPGLRQVQVNAKIDWTFAKALRAFLRADPDVIMVGEIRDQETASIAVEASLTGHLVLSTLHTNSAPETVTRLLDMGMDPFNFADSLLAVIAQRLVRRLCRHCRIDRPMSDAVLDELVDDFLHAWPQEEDRPTREALVDSWRQSHGRQGQLLEYFAPGCKHCGHTGHTGRLGIHELLVADRQLRHLIQSGGRPEQLLSSAMRSGMLTLRQDGILKVLEGKTTLSEVRATSNG